MNLFEPLRVLYVALLPILLIYAAIPFGGLLVFFLLFAFVIRNPRLGHFLRFHTLQAILMMIFLSLCSIALEILGLSGRIGAGIFGASAGGFSPFDLLFSALFLATLIASIFGIIRAAQGEYADLPIVTEAARNMMPY
jgi:uncharacterized membrane protein